MFSVVIPTTDRATLDAAVASVRAQGVEVELLIERDPRRSGPAATRNRALARATQPFVAFLDDDDRWLPGRLADAIAAHRAGADVVVACGRHVTAETVFDSEVPSLDGTTVRRELALRFDERFRGCEDAEWLLRVAMTGARFAAVSPHTFSVEATGPRPDHYERIAGHRLLLEVHADWFATHPRAAAYRWERYGRMQLTVGAIAEARYALRRALRRPSAWKPYAKSLVS